MSLFFKITQFFMILPPFYSSTAPTLCFLREQKLYIQFIIYIFSYIYLYIIYSVLYAYKFYILHINIIYKYIIQIQYTLYIYDLLDYITEYELGNPKWLSYTKEYKYLIAVSTMKLGVPAVLQSDLTLMALGIPGELMALTLSEYLKG